MPSAECIVLMSIRVGENAIYHIILAIFAVQDFHSDPITEDRFRRLLFLAGLKSSRDAGIRKRLISMLDLNPNYKSQQPVGECR